MTQDNSPLYTVYRNGDFDQCVAKNLTGHYASTAILNDEKYHEMLTMNGRVNAKAEELRQELQTRLNEYAATDECEVMKALISKINELHRTLNSESSGEPI